MIHYNTTNVWCSVRGLTAIQEEWLDRETSFEAPGARFSYRMRALIRQGLTDGRTHLYDKLRHRFPAGLLPMVHSKLGGEIEYSGIGPEPKIDPFTPELIGKTLAPWQGEAVQAMIKGRRGVARLATNAGKTVMMASLCRLIREEILVLVPKKILMAQTVRELTEMLGEKVGLVGGGKIIPGRVVVALPNSIHWRRKAWITALSKFRVLLIDECHHASAKTWYHVAMRCYGAQFRIGLSGTPFHRGDPARNMRMLGATGFNVLAEKRNKELIQMGWSARPIVHVRDFKGAENGFEWDVAFERLLKDRDYNRDVIMAIKEQTDQGRPCLVLTHRIQHGVLLRDMLAGEDIEAKFVNGNDPDAWREAKIAQMRSGRLQVIIGTSVFDEGVDVPVIGAVVLASAGKSQRELLQRIGRGIRRKAKGDNVVHVVDWRVWTNYYLLRHHLERRTIFKEEGFEVQYET